MKEYTVLVERCLDTGMFVASIPGIPGAQGQGGSPDDAVATLEEILALLSEDGEPRTESEFIETRTLAVE